LATQHKQNQFFKDHGEFVEPIAIRDESNDTDAIGYIIPFEEKLKHLLSNPETESIAFKTTDLSILRSKNIKSNISDGTFIQDSICEQAEIRDHVRREDCIEPEFTLLFALYYDDVEIVNAIGSAKKKHKLGKFDE
jgi:hypothetical protein